jgi:hypothetical protein
MLLSALKGNVLDMVIERGCGIGRKMLVLVLSSRIAKALVKSGDCRQPEPPPQSSIRWAI